MARYCKERLQRVLEYALLIRPQLSRGVVNLVGVAMGTAQSFSEEGGGGVAFACYRRSMQMPDA